MNTHRSTGLTLLLGPANSGKLGRVLAWWQVRLSERPVVVTPTAPDARELTAEMLSRAGGLVQQAPAVTFDGLVQLVLGHSPRYATDLERRLVVSGVLSATATEALKVAARLPGAVPALETLLQQLGESGLSPEQLDQVLLRWAQADPESSTIADDLRRLTAAYQTECARLGLGDRPTAVREATAALRGAVEPRGVSWPVWTRPVGLYGFTSFTPGQRSLVEELAKRTEVLVTFTYDSARDLNLSAPAEIGWWRSRASEVAVVSSGTRAYDSAAIEYLEHYYMSGETRPEPPSRIAADEGVRFMRASGRRAEAELAAEQIAELLRTGFEAPDIAVVVRSVSSWSGLLSRVFDSCAIPYNVDHRPLLGQTGFGHAFLNAVRGVFENDARAVLAYLRSPYSGLSLEAVSDLELLYRRGTTKGAKALAAIGVGIEMQPVISLWELSASPRWLHLGAARRLIRGMVTTASIGACCGDADLEEDARSFRALEGALDTLASMESGGAEAVDDHGRPLVDYRTVLSGLGSTVIAPRLEHLGEVQVLSVQRARARRFAVVFLLGLVEGEFPGRVDRPSLLSPPQRSRLDRVAGGLFAEDADEAALFMSALSRASRLLYLSTRDAEDDGSEATPSYFWTRAKDLLGQGGIDPLVRTLGDQVYSPRLAPTQRHYERACVAAGLGLSPAAGPRRALPSWDCRPVSLCDPRVIAELGATQRFSPSALESYAKCPFAWFVQKIVGAEELEIEMDGRQIGQLLHSVLSGTYQELESSGLLPLRAGMVTAAQAVAGRKIDELVNGADCPGTVAERRLAAWQLRRMVGNLFDMEVAAEWPLVPHELEVWVGSRYGVDVGGFKVHGRVDRVDATCDRRGQFVIDYKSGNIPANSAIGGKEGLQLPLYLMAMAAERPRSAILGGAYLGLSDKKRSGIAVEGAEQLLGDAVQGCRVLDPTAMEELLQKTVDISRQAVDGMRSGVIAPRDDRSCPPWCSLAPACRARKGGYRP